MIEKALLRMETAHAKGNSSEEDWEYHQSIIEATGNPLFTQIIQSMRDLVHQFWENPLQLPHFAEASFPFHRTMFDAIARRDPQAAHAPFHPVVGMRFEIDFLPGTQTKPSNVRLVHQQNHACAVNAA